MGWLRRLAHRLLTALARALATALIEELHHRAPEILVRPRSAPPTRHPTTFTMEHRQ